jgi:hypothetical protein
MIGGIDGGNIGIGPHSLSHTGCHDHGSFTLSVQSDH